VWYGYLNNPRQADGRHDFQKQSLLGPSFTNQEAKEQLAQYGCVYHEIEDGELFGRVAELLASEKVVGWFQGRMEFGPRALGNRSILADPRSTKMQSTLNLKIKFRESFRPFAPAVLRERVSEYFQIDSDSPYMLMVAPVAESIRIPMTTEQEQLFGIDKLNVPRSKLPAITHVDYSARIQTVSNDAHPRFYQLLKAFDQLTGCPVLVNTSFNVRGEPIVCTPDSAFICFMRTNMDVLVINNLVFLKEEQPAWHEEQDWRDSYELD
jgi:carbamoyltransferase